MTYRATYYEGRLAILDTQTKVYYFGFKTMKEARERADQLNKEA